VPDLVAFTTYSQKVEWR